MITRIDLAHLNQKTKEILKSLFINKKEANLFTKDIVYEVPAINVRVSLSHDIIKRLRNKNHSEVRYEVIDHNNLLGKGAFGSVYGVLNTLAIKDNELLVKTNKERVVKIQTCNQDELAGIQNEVDITQKANTMHMKQPVNIKTGFQQYNAYMVMRKLHGTDLYAVINQLYCNQVDLSTHQRLSIAIDLLKQLKTLHDNGIVHRDIKPENVMIDLNTKELVIFDFGLSKFSKEDDKDLFLGTLGYIPLEVFQYKGTTTKSDIFSMAIVIGLLFYAEEPKEKVNRYMPYTFENLFNDPKLDLNDSEKLALKNALIKMSLDEMDLRFNASEALQAFIDIRENYVNRKIDEMVANRPNHYLLVNGLFVNNKFKNKKQVVEEKRLRRESCPAVITKT